MRHLPCRIVQEFSHGGFYMHCLRCRVLLQQPSNSLLSLHSWDGLWQYWSHCIFPVR